MLYLPLSLFLFLSIVSVLVLPQQCMYATFDASAIHSLELAVLFANPQRIDIPTNQLIYNTRGRGVTKDDISPPCRVSWFTEISLYTIPCANKNILLKYQGQGVVDVRRLTTTKVGKGAFGVFKSVLSGQGAVPDEQVLDFTTNVEEISQDMCSSAHA